MLIIKTATEGRLALIAGLLCLVALLLACGPAAPAVENPEQADVQQPPGQRSLEAVPSQDQPLPQALVYVPPLPSSPAGSPQESGPPSPKPTLNPSDQFRQSCHITGFNMFRNATDNLEDNIWCYQRQLEEFQAWLTILPANPSLADVQTAYQEVQVVAAGDPEVATAYTKVLVCLADQGYTDLNAQLLFPWQDFVSAADYETRMRGLTDAETTLQVELYPVSDTCASGDSAYYYLLGKAWRAEIARLQKDGPATVKPLADIFLIDAINRPGPDPTSKPIPGFLTLAGGSIFRDGAGPHPTPVPTTIPDQSRVRSALEPTPAPPANGIESCRAFSAFGGSTLTSHEVTWCARTSIEEVQSQCSGLPTAAEQLSCADTYFDSWKELQTKLLNRCFALTDQETFHSCFADADLEQRFSALSELVVATLGVVARDSEVIKAQANVGKCLNQRGFTERPLKLLFPWQTTIQFLGRPLASEEWNESLTAAEWDLLDRLQEPTDACARQHGLYVAQDAAWLAEIKRLEQDDSASLQPFVDWGVVDIVAQDGIAPFLTRP